MHIEVLDGIEAYSSEVLRYVSASPKAQLYHTPSWISCVINELDCQYKNIIFRDEKKSICGWMPIFLKSGPAGLIANSSPYFGTHGGLLCENELVASQAIRIVISYLKEQDVKVLNVIPPLLDEFKGVYENSGLIATNSKRIAHVKDLSILDSRDNLFNSLGGLARSNLKRKCWKSGMEIIRDESDAAIDWLYYHHVKQMDALSVTPKTKTFFKHFIENRNDGVEGRIYLAKLNNNFIAALFLCVWNDWVEYLTPVFDLEYRKYQPLSAVIFEAMYDCMSEGFKKWNFGGSGKSLQSVKSFKESWKGYDQEYCYQIFDINNTDKIKTYTKKNGNKGYEGFFVYPY